MINGQWACPNVLNRERSATWVMDHLVISMTGPPFTWMLKNSWAGDLHRSHMWLEILIYAPSDLCMSEQRQKHFPKFWTGTNLFNPFCLGNRRSSENGSEEPSSSSSLLLPQPEIINRICKNAAQTSLSHCLQTDHQLQNKVSGQV